MTTSAFAVTKPTPSPLLCTCSYSESRSCIDAGRLLFSTESALIENTTTTTGYVIDPAKRLFAQYEIA